MLPMVGIPRVVYMPPMVVYPGWYTQGGVYASLPGGVYPGGICLPTTPGYIPPPYTPGYTHPPTTRTRVPGVPTPRARARGRARDGALGSGRPKAVGGRTFWRSGTRKCQRSYGSARRIIRASAREWMNDRIARGASLGQGGLGGSLRARRSGGRKPSRAMSARGIPGPGAW